MIVEILLDVLSWIVNFLGRTALYWVPVLLLYVGWRVWLQYIQLANISNKNWILLELNIPKDIYRSPAAMEVFLSNAIHQTGGMGTWYHRYWLGNVHTWFSLEMVSDAGRVKFYIRLEEKWRRLIEAQLYAQYPNIEIKQVEDYVEETARQMTREEWSMFGGEFKLAKDDAYPIKTYIDYGLDKAVGSLDEEQKIDPISPFVEFLASMRAGEKVWFQILVRPSIERFKDPTHPFKKKDWKDDAKRVKEELMKEHIVIEEDGKKKRNIQNMTQAEKEALTAIERSISKTGFDVGMRGIYLAQKDAFDPINITGLLGCLKQYNSVNLNGFRPTNTTGFDYPWEDPTGSRARRLKKKMFNAYWDRGLFYKPYKGDIFVLNSEELATVFHFPSKATEAPTFERIEAKKATPPPNLPI
jgi:hypothetical protein